MAKPFRLQGYTRAPRHELIQAVRDALLGVGVHLTDVQAFSNASVRLTLEAPASRLEDLHRALSALPLALTPDLEAFLASAGSDGVPALREGTLALFFQHQDPDLRLTIPAVPG